MNPLHIPRTILACVGVAIDTAVQMHCQNRDYEAAVRAAAPESEPGRSVAPSCPLGGACPTECDRSPHGCVQIWGPAEEHTEALRRNLIDPQWQMYGPGTFKVADGAELLARVEADREVWAPGEFDPHRAVPNMDGYCMVRLSNGKLCDLYEGNALHQISVEALNGRLPHEKDPAGERFTLGDTAPAGHPDPAASATAAPSPAIPPASDTDPVGVVDGPPASAAPTGPPSELVELIAAVLDAHEGHYNRASSVFECVEYPADGGFRRVPVGDDYQGWLQHVAPLIAERIEKAAPPDAFVIADWVADAARYIGGLPEDAARRVATSVSVRFAEATITP